MPFFFKNRQTDLEELMDNENCDLVRLENTYRQFSTINLLLSNWKKIYKTYLKPAMIGSEKRYTLLDIGFGGGDIPIAISKWAEGDGINLKITAVETDQRSFDFARKLASNVEFKYCSSSDLVKEADRFDFVISNHVLHHLNNEDFFSVLNDAKTLSKKTVIFNDIERSDIGYLMFNIFSRPLFWNSFITTDGLTSIKRSYTKRELSEIAPQGWKVKRSFPFRLLLIHE